MTAGSCSWAISRRRPPHWAHANTSMPNARCIRAAQLQARGLAVFASVPSGSPTSGAVEAVGSSTRLPAGNAALSGAARVQGASLSSQPPWLPLIPPLAGQMSNEIGSDLEIATDLRRHYGTTGSRTMVEVEGRLAHLDHFFTGRRVAAIGQSDVTTYILHRQTKGAANGIINRELGVLIRMFKLAYEIGKLLRPPVIRKLRESGPRQGFFEHKQYQKIRRYLPADLQVAITIAYTFGWRMQSEVLTLERRQLDLKLGALRLEPGTTKNNEGRLVYLTPELRSLMTAQVNRVAALERQTRTIIPFL